MKKALKYAKTALQREPDQLILYVHIMDKIVHLKEVGLHSMPVQSIDVCLGIIQENIGRLSASAKEKLEDYLERVVAHVKKRKIEAADKFGEVSLIN